MQRSLSRPDRRRRVGIGLAVTAALTGVVLAGCSDDDASTDGTVVVDDDFPGDSLDATCARLEAADGDDREAIAGALIDELSQVADPQIVINTLEMAVVDRCPDWADAVTAAIESRS